MEGLHERFRELVRDILDLPEDVEAGPADPEHVASKAEELIEVLGVIYALSDQDIDHRVTANIDSTGCIRVRVLCGQWIFVLK